MRLGKTLVAIRWALQRLGPYLVICPLEAIGVWLYELELEGERRTISRLRSSAPPTRLRPDGWVIINFESVFERSTGGAPSEWLRRPYSTVIVDESDRIANPQAATTRAIYRGTREVPRRAILSGLPAPEGLQQYYEQMRFLHGSFMGCSNFWTWRQRHCIPPAPGQYRWWVRKSSRAQLTREIACSAYRLTAADVEGQQGAVNEPAYVVLPDYEVYSRIENEWEIDDAQSTQWSMVVHSWLHRLTGGCLPPHEHTAKANLLRRLVRGDLRNQRLIVWFAYNAELRLTSQVLRDEPHHLLHGKVSPYARKRAIDDWRSGGRRLLLCQVRIGTYGLDLSAADAAIYYSVVCSHAKLAQSQARILHPRKREPSLCVWLLAYDTIDEDIYRAYHQKAKRSETFLQAVHREYRRRRRNLQNKVD